LTGKSVYNFSYMTHTSIKKGASNGGASGQFLKLSLITLRRSSTLCES